MRSETEHPNTLKWTVSCNRVKKRALVCVWIWRINVSRLTCTEDQILTLTRGHADHQTSMWISLSNIKLFFFRAHNCLMGVLNVRMYYGDDRFLLRFGSSGTCAPFFVFISCNQCWNLAELDVAIRTAPHSGRTRRSSERMGDSSNDLFIPAGSFMLSMPITSWKYTRTPPTSCVSLSLSLSLSLSICLSQHHHSGAVHRSPA